jgi:hypothetical protein
LSLQLPKNYCHLRAYSLYEVAYGRKWLKPPANITGISNQFLKNRLLDETGPRHRMPAKQMPAKQT